MPAPLRLSHIDLPPAETHGSVRVRLGDVLPSLIDAHQSRRVWLQDFCDDTVQIPHDLYETLLAYQQQVPRSAA